MKELTVRSVTVDLEGGQLLRVSRYTDPASGRTVVTLARAWTDDVVSFPSEGQGVLTLPAGCTADLMAALEELEADGGD